MAAESSLPNDGGGGRGQNEFGGGSRQTHAASFYRASLLVNRALGTEQLQYCLSGEPAVEAPATLLWAA